MTRERKKAIKETLKTAPPLENPTCTPGREFSSVEYLEAIVNGEQFSRYEDVHGQQVSRAQWLEDTRRGLLADIDGILSQPNPSSLYVKGRRTKT